jgi:enoyl-CoA hydratase/carnithine racemase
MSATVATVDDGPVRYLVLQRAERRNALDRALLESLAEAAQAAARAPATRVVVIRGEGPAFCSGVDRAFLGELLASEDGVEEVRGVIGMIQNLWNTLESMPKVTIAEIHGLALGGGAELALACDLRTMAADAELALIHTRLGFLPETGGCSRLASLVGVGRAKEIILTARPVGAEEAGRIGLANRVAEPESLSAVTAALAAEVLPSAPLGIAAAKRIIDTSAKPLLATTLEMEMTASARLFTTNDAAEAAAAFAERRPPAFSGR